MTGSVLLGAALWGQNISNAWRPRSVGIYGTAMVGKTTLDSYMTTPGEMYDIPIEERTEHYKILTRYILPNILTIAGVCLGISSIKFSLDLNFKMAVIFITLAAILDALDGRIARLIKGTSDFGKELDSLTDFVSFGIAPVFILYFWELNNYGKLGWAITLICLLYTSPSPRDQRGCRMPSSA